MGAPIGNQNAARGRVWRAAIERALDRRSQSRADGIKEIDAVAEKLVEAAFGGDIAALKELGDRLEGKPAQAIVGEEGAPPVKMEGVIKLVKPE